MGFVEGIRLFIPSSPKYNYTRDDSGNYTFNDHKGKVVALFREKSFHDNVTFGSDVVEVSVTCSFVKDSDIGLGWCRA